MWDFSDAAVAALSTSHTAVNRVEIWHSGVPTGVTLSVGSGQVEADADRPVRRNLDVVLFDPTGDLSTDDVGDLLNPYECEVAPYRGVRTRDGDELAPQGVFRLTGRDVNDGPDGLTIALTGQDRTIMYQGPMDSALAIRGGTPVETAIQMLLARRNAKLVYHDFATGYTCGPLIYAPGIDVWTEASALATSVAATLYHSRTGVATLSPAGPTRSTAASYGEGNRLLTLSRAENSDTVSNVVVAENSKGTIRAVAEDTDPKSPTYSRGSYGRRVADPIVSDHFGSVTQALHAATARLTRLLGRSETTTFTAIVDPGLDVDEVATVDRPRAGLDRRAVVVANLVTPLTVDASMRVVGRKSVLAEDGRVLTTGGEI